MRAMLAVGMGMMFLVGCGKGYIVSTDIDQKGNKKKVVIATEVQRDWAWFVGSDITKEYPLRCPYEALNWKGDLDKEQCTIDHDHLTGPNKGQTRERYTVHANDTIGKKILPTLWMAALWGWLASSGGHGDQTNNQTVSQTSNNAFNDNVQVTTPVTGHSIGH